MLEDAVFWGLNQAIKLELVFRPEKEELQEEKAAALAMAKRLKWNHVALLSNDEHLMKAYAKALAERGDICVTASILVNTKR